MVYTLSQFKAVLNGLGYRLSPNDIKVDGIEVTCVEADSGNFPDRITQAAIQAFQAQFGLPITGECDRITQEKARDLVRNLQHSLNLTMAAGLPVNEFYGPRTMRAVQAFQEQHGLPPTGIAGTTTRCRLNEDAKQQLRKLTGSLSIQN